jgi:hypothetical protein
MEKYWSRSLWKVHSARCHGKISVAGTLEGLEFPFPWEDISRGNSGRFRVPVAMGKYRHGHSGRFRVPVPMGRYQSRSLWKVRSARSHEKISVAVTLEGSQCPLPWENIVRGYSGRFRVPVAMEKYRSRSLWKVHKARFHGKISVAVTLRVSE